RCTCLASKARFHKSLGHRPWDVFSVYPKLITRNSGMLPDSWRGHFVRVPAQITNLRDTSGKMPELRPESDPNRTSENLLTLNTYWCKSPVPTTKCGEPRPGATEWSSRDFRS